MCKSKQTPLASMTLIALIFLILAFVELETACSRPFEAKKIYVAVMTGDQRTDLLELQMNLWMRNLTRQPYVSDLKLFGWKPLQSENKELLERYVDVPCFPGDKSRDFLAGKLVRAIEMFLASGCGWFLRVCDDVFIE